MRWFWVDRFIEFNSGVSAKAVKNVALAEEHLHDHFPGFPVMPASLIIEGLAQTGGILLAECRQFKDMVILAKIPKVVFHDWARPGDTLIYSAKLENCTEEGGMASCQAHIGERLAVECDIMYAHVAQAGADQKRWLLTMLKSILTPGPLHMPGPAAPK